MAYYIIWPPFLLSLTSVMYIYTYVGTSMSVQLFASSRLDEANRLVMGHDSTLVCLRRV